MKVLLLTSKHYGLGDSYAQALAELRKAGSHNASTMYISNDDNLSFNSGGYVEHGGGKWLLRVPLQVDRSPTWDLNGHDMEKTWEKAYKDIQTSKNV